MLTGGTTYRLAWDFSVGSLINGDPAMQSNIDPAPGASYFSISFVNVPTPGAGALLALAALAAGRRRRA